MINVLRNGKTGYKSSSQYSHVNAEIWDFKAIPQAGLSENGQPLQSGPVCLV
jgi:hypothetical protein